MGTLNFTVTDYAPSARKTDSTIPSTDVVTSGSFTTSGTAANIEDGSGDITLSLGQVLQATAIGSAMWVSFGGTTAAAGTGFYIPLNATREWECSEAGVVSSIDG